MFIYWGETNMRTQRDSALPTCLEARDMSMRSSFNRFLLCPLD
ncbi:hypothetical protein PISS_a2001 [Pseudoalteromonas issachenkonii]|uniref:Uncharacterized protein n=1 Tax=Pseudoalteromonas issachenkonii TaxID=152297 RepID=A0ABN5C8A5_9GAMM|nr:hypothetical protein PISS_a2001 [Pseudoalteromonas issachenkonii]